MTVANRKMRTGLPAGRFIRPYFVTYYKDYARHKKHSVLEDRVAVSRILCELWKTVGDHFLTNEGGVYLDNIGYICHVIRPRKRYGSFNNGIADNNADGNNYDSTVMPMRYFNRRWNFTVEVSEALRTASSNAVKEGYRYRFLYKELKSLLPGRRGWKILKKWNKNFEKCLLESL